MSEKKYYLLLLNIVFSVAILVLLSSNVYTEYKLRWCVILTIGIFSGNASELLRNLLRK